MTRCRGERRRRIKWEAVRGAGVEGQETQRAWNKYDGTEWRPAGCVKHDNRDSGQVVSGRSVAKGWDDLVNAG